ncbi:hypothetical protein B7463_g9749, partial [Scytalidium lignicola]
MSLNSVFLEQNCNYALKNCNFAGVEGESCASEFCNGFPSTSGTCPQIGLDPQNCCGSDNPSSCLETWVHGSGGGGGGDASSNPCASVVGIILACSSASPALFPSQTIYDSGPGATALAGCLCYDSDGTYDPDALDGYASECVASGEAAHPTYFPYASRLNGFCSINGPANAAPSTTAPQPSSSVPQTHATTTSPVQVLTTSSAPKTSASSVLESNTSNGPVSTASSHQNSGPLTPVTLPSGNSGSASSVTPGPASTNTLQAGTILLLGISVLFNFY